MRDAGDPGAGQGRQPSDPEQVARAIVLRQLEAAPRTRAHLEGVLAARSCPDDVARRVLDRFEEVGLVDDRLFASMWVDSRHAGRRLSSRALAAELQRHGVAEDVIRDSVSTVTPEMEEAAARELARRRAASVQGLPSATAVRRLSGFLARRGFGPALTARVVREVLSSQAESGVGDGVLDEHLPLS